jgi:hypothetical protein
MEVQDILLRACPYVPASVDAYGYPVLAEFLYSSVHVATGARHLSPGARCT